MGRHLHAGAPGSRGAEASGCAGPPGEAGFPPAQGLLPLGTGLSGESPNKTRLRKSALFHAGSPGSIEVPEEWLQVPCTSVPGAPCPIYPPCALHQTPKRHSLHVCPTQCLLYPQQRPPPPMPHEHVEQGVVFQNLTAGCGNRTGSIPGRPRGDPPQVGGDEFPCIAPCPPDFVGPEMYSLDLPTHT